MGDLERLSEVDEILRSRYPEVPALAFSSPFSLLVAAVLAAQCTDERVNQVTKTLFERYPDARAFAEAVPVELEEAVHATGFFRQKARTLIACGRALTDRFGGEVPPEVEALTSVPGIGRKTAQLVLGNSLGLPAVFVDTHVKRVAFRLGFTKHTDPEKIEGDLTALLPPERRTPFSNLLTHLGREACAARKPRCPQCPVAPLCPRAGVA